MSFPGSATPESAFPTSVEVDKMFKTEKSGVFFPVQLLFK